MRMLRDVIDRLVTVIGLPNSDWRDYGAQSGAIEAYCLRCGAMRGVRRPRLKTADFRLWAEGRCGECGGRVSTLLKLGRPPGVPVKLDPDCYVVVSELARRLGVTRGHVVRQAVGALLEKLGAP